MTPDSHPTNTRITRRAAMKAAIGTASATAAAAAIGPVAASAQERAREVDDDVSVATDGNYERVPLRKDVIRVTAVQSPIQAADASIGGQS